MAEAKPIVAVEDLVKTYEGVNVVDGISFTVNRGEIFGILGPNGAGKTTTLEMLEALRTIDAGTASIDGIDVGRNPKKIKQIIGIQLQSTDFYNMLTLREQLKMFASLYGTKADVGALLAKVQLTEKSKTFVEKLSGGQKQRLSVARAFLKDAPILVLDEMTSNVDPVNEVLMQKAVSALAQNRTVLVVAHHLSTIRSADQIIVMQQGKIVQRGTHEQLLEENAGYYRTLWEQGAKTEGRA